MFGSYRYIPSMLVVFGHTYPFYHRQLNWTGHYAVWGFFVLSGYLMTRVLHETYGFSPRGLGRFALNRALRIYPPYWAAASFAAVVWFVLPAPPAGKFLPSSLDDLVRNLVLFGLTYGVPHRLIPPAWSLHLEVCFYLLMALGLARPRVVGAWLAGSLLVSAVLITARGPVYGSLPAASLPFSAGAAAYLLGARMPTVPPLAIVPVVALFTADALSVWFPWQAGVGATGFHVSFILAVATVLVLGRADGRRASPRLSRVDRLLGDLSYPIFLVHVPMVAVVAACVRGRVRVSSLAFLAVCLLPIHLGAYVLQRMVAAPVERLRDRVRGNRHVAPPMRAG